MANTVNGKFFICDGEGKNICSFAAFENGFKEALSYNSRLTPEKYLEQLKDTPNPVVGGAKPVNNLRFADSYDGYPADYAYC